METKENGVFVRLNEKPMVSYQINTGFYILQPELLNKIPENTFFHITDLIESLIKNGERVGVFPISEGSWKDIGLWNEFIKINKIY
jgi:NDP-sugar pyrophosphorylase family protein